MSAVVRRSPQGVKIVLTVALSLAACAWAETGAQAAVHPRTIDATLIQSADQSNPRAELSRAATRAHKSRVARLKARYARMARVRARIPTNVRQARARNELANMQRQGTLHCLTTAIYHEARYESAGGQRAVAEVILARTRVKGRPKSVCGVVYEGAWRATGCQFSFTCDGLSDGARDPHQWARAKKVAATALRQKGAKKRLARGATFYHAAYVKPRWAKRMVRVAKIGTHIFYRPR